MIRRILFLFLLLPIHGVESAPLYKALAEQARPDEKELVRARKQIEERRDIEIKDNLFVPPFHKRGEQAATKRKPVCTICHLELPHRENVRSRTFLNMHSRYIACETCHLRPKDYALEYDWVDFGATVEEPAQTEKAAPASERNRTSRIQARPGLRIAPFYAGERAIIFSDHAFSRELEKTWSDADAERKIRLKAKLHGFLERKGPECIDCHRSKDPFLDLASLGANARQIRAMQNNVIPRFFARFKKKDEKLRMTDLLR